MSIQFPDPIVTAKRSYTNEMQIFISKVFGDKGLNLAKGYQCEISIQGPSRTICNFETREIRTVMNHKDWLKNMPAVIHEFAHHYTNHFFMGVAVNAPSANHEACAIVAELMMMSECPEYGPIVRARIRAIRTHPLDIYRQAMEMVDKHMDDMQGQPIHNIMLRLINDYS